MSQTNIELTQVASRSAAPNTATSITTEQTQEPQQTSQQKVVRKDVTAVIISTITGVTLISSLLSGLVTISLPALATELEIPTALLLWPSSIYALTCGCTLILSGTIADVVGSRNMYLIGTFLQSVFTLACGLAQTSSQLILFRALAGIAISFCLPSAVSLIMTYFAAGKQRNVAFGSMGGGQPLGFSLGLTIGGVLTDKVGWRSGFYIAAGLNSVLFIVAMLGLPAIRRTSPLSFERLKTEVDWVGAFLLSSSLALLSFVFASLTGSVTNIQTPASIASLSLGFILIPTFVMWASMREKQGKAVLIRNSLWRNKGFTSICLNVFLVWGSFNATETLLTFLFQDVQDLSATEAAVRFLPAPITGVLCNIAMALFVHRLQANWALIVAFAVSSLSPLLLAVSQARSSYWQYAFPAVALNPIGADTLFTISNLLITAEFDEKTQALAGGVFNTIAQIGKSVGLALAAVIASSITMKLERDHIDEDRSLFGGYQAAWWFTMAITLASVAITVWGLRGVGKVGLKRE